MRILFHTNGLGKLRHFDSVTCELAERGHDVILVLEGRAVREHLRLCRCHEPFPIISGPEPRTDAWAAHVRSLRTVRDYARYFDGDLAGASAMRERARDWAHRDAPRFVEAIDRWRRVRQGIRTVDAAARFVEDIIPSDPGYEAFFKEHAPDVILVTPMIEFGSPQPDIVKSAHRLGIPIGFLPFSWDNLSSKGLIRVIPDRVMVWNEVQRDEAVRWHDVAPERIVITGAPRFDDFFARGPSVDRKEYLREMGFRRRGPIVLFLGSSPLVAPDELPLVREWLRALRDAPGKLSNANVLLRPHPKNLAQWDEAEFEDDRTRIHRVTSLKEAERPLYDALHHSQVVVGVNTSALLEAAIVGRSVHAPPPVGDAAASYGRTLHERYLSAEDALLVSSSTFPEHLEQLQAVLDDPALHRERTLAFVRSFLRPLGLDRPVSPIMVDEIERLAEMRKPRMVPPVWHRPVGVAVRGVLRAGLDPGAV